MVESAYGMFPTAGAELRIAVSGYDPIRRSAALVIPERGDLVGIPLPRVGAAFQRVERVRRLVEASGWPDEVDLLVERDLLRGGSVEYRSLAPLEDDSLLASFLELRRATRGYSRAQAVARFAGRYGFLGLPVIIQLDGRAMSAELLADWSSEVERLTDLDQLRLRLESLRGDRHHYDYGKAINYLRARYEPLAASDLEVKGRSELHEAINARLIGNIEAGVSRQGRLVWVPTTLLAAIYLRFASRVLGARPRTRVCKQCGSVFEVTKGDRIYCSTSCVKKASYARHPKRRVNDE